MIKKALVMFLLTAVAISARATEEQFCKGFAVGYLEGWNYSAAQGEKPPVPPCQIGLLENDDDSTLSSFEQGEKKGIQRGIKAFKDDLDSGSPTDVARKNAAKAAEAAEQLARVQEEKRRASDLAAQKQAAIAQDKALEQEYMQHAAALVTCLSKAIPDRPQPPANETGRFRQAYIDQYQRQEPERLATVCQDMQVLGVIQRACTNETPADVRAALQVQAGRMGIVLNCETQRTNVTATPVAPPNTADSVTLPASTSSERTLRTQETVSTTQAVGTGPSFDCRKASTNVENLICNTPELAAADSSLSQLYETFIIAGNKAAVLPSQRTFVTRRNLCSTIACVAQAYKARQDELEALRRSMDQ